MPGKAGIPPAPKRLFARQRAQPVKDLDERLYVMLSQILHCLLVFLVYIVPLLLVLLPIRFLTRLPSFVFRKLLHIVAFTSVSLMILTTESWQAAALTSVLIAVALYPVLSALEHAPWFQRLFVQKSPGEIKRSLLLLFFMFAALISVSWGLFDQPILAAAAILMWGAGDAAAALVGIPCGKHKVRSRFTDGKKSWEGSLAMLAVSFLSAVTVLLFVQKLPLPQVLVMSALGSVLGAATELFSPSEYDTATVPVVIAAVLLLLANCW